MPPWSDISDSRVPAGETGFLFHFSQVAPGRRADNRLIVPAVLPTVRFAGNPDSSSVVSTASSSLAVNPTQDTLYHGSPEQVFFRYDKARSKCFKTQPPRLRTNHAYRKEHGLPLTYTQSKYNFQHRGLPEMWRRAEVSLAAAELEYAHDLQ
ncbi:hypothetical protein E4U13_004639 [Claviceps humidiphila]|uniref:Uncharacterized protein n=1 Tax=Claviceps humidiphila TaxID=1294629 RepID=A0A9P7PYU5_9HYPO|nr:hypothetical protein E4U13_004639 [Claviceps humidiphila]